MAVLSALLAVEVVGLASNPILSNPPYFQPLRLNPLSAPSTFEPSPYEPCSNPLLVERLCNEIRSVSANSFWRQLIALSLPKPKQSPPRAKADASPARAEALRWRNRMLLKPCAALALHCRMGALGAGELLGRSAVDGYASVACCRLCATRV